MASSLRLVCVSLALLCLVMGATAADLGHALSSDTQQQVSQEQTAAGATAPHSRSKRWSSSWGKSGATGFGGTGTGTGSGFYIPVYRKTGAAGNFGNLGNTGTWGVPMTGGVPFSGGVPMTGGVPFSGGVPMTGGVPFTGGVGGQPMSYIKQVSYFPQQNAGLGTMTGGLGTMTGGLGTFGGMGTFGGVPNFGGGGLVMGGGMMID